ncbi:hypothetical protein [Acidiplasma cupricumulans]|uniref:hypothetical protein n=1 Tax=Acidiplasma cupricumulans TaxID=312540 RepID=UPI000A668A8B|nr:hypothetical protein [Acidiplasma cupricumulans]
MIFNNDNLSRKNLLFSNAALKSPFFALIYPCFRAIIASYFAGVPNFVLIAEISEFSMTSVMFSKFS